MKNVKNVNYVQIDHKIQIFEGKDVITLSSPEAYKRFRWTREHFKRKPEEGYFIWVKNSINYPLITRISISSKNVSQNPINLVIIEKNVETKIYSICNSVKKNLCGNHTGYSKIIVKENSILEMKHFHKWGKGDTVKSSLELFLKKGAKLSYVYRCLDTPMNLEIENNNYLEANSSANLVITVLASHGEVEMCDSTFLNGKDSNGISRIRMIGDKISSIIAHSRMIANDAGTGHVDCMGLLLSDDSSINAIPELLNNHKDASLTHEASVGKISEEVMNYLRSRGLTENQAIDLIVTGFLGEEEPIVIEGRTVPSKLYM